jgi:hypothetical protein
LQRAIHTQDDEPALARYGLDPVAFLALGCLRGELEIYGAIRIGQSPAFHGIVLHRGAYFAIFNSGFTHFPLK